MLEAQENQGFADLLKVYKQEKSVDSSGYLS